MTRSIEKMVIVLGLLGISVVSYSVWRASHQTVPQTQSIVSVQTFTVTPHAVPDIIDTSASLIPTQSVQVLPQTGGMLESISIHDGEEVTKGQLLFTIDPRPLQAALRQAEANLARDQALAVDAEDTERRMKTLVMKDSVVEKTYVTARNTLNSLRATVAADQEQITATRLSLDYTQVRAPIGGRAGAVLVKPGNVVSTASTTPLVVLNVSSPIEATFGLPRVQIDAVLAARRTSGNEALPVLALNPVTGKQIERGALAFLDNAYDSSSGTLTLRASFANSDRALWPGDFITVRVLLSDGAGALTVPESSLQQGQQGRYVFSVKAGHAVLQPIKITRLVDGEAVVSEGIQAGDQIIVAVPNDLRDGTAVQSSGGNGSGERKQTPLSR